MNSVLYIRKITLEEYNQFIKEQSGDLNSRIQGSRVLALFCISMQGKVISQKPPYQLECPPPLKDLHTEGKLRGAVRAVNCGSLYPGYLWSGSGSLLLHSCHDKVTKKCGFFLNFRFVGIRKSSIGHCCHLTLVKQY